MALMQIIIFAALAVFVLVRLYNVLGKNIGARPQKPTPKGLPAGTATIAASKAAPPRPAFTGPAAAGLEAIRAADSNFDPARFVAGARLAYERIVEAYSRGDKKTLKPLLKPDVYTRYAKAIDARNTEGRELDTEIIRIRKAEITEAEVRGRQARIVVVFGAEISTRQGQRENPQDEHVETATTLEEWTFVRDLRSRDPNWKLAGVASIA